MPWRENWYMGSIDFTGVRTWPVLAVWGQQVSPHPHSSAVRGQGSSRCSVVFVISSDFCKLNVIFIQKSLLVERRLKWRLKKQVQIIWVENSQQKCNLVESSNIQILNKISNLENYKDLRMEHLFIYEDSNLCNVVNWIWNILYSVLKTTDSVLVFSANCQSF
jgi:hypothetical protein